METTQTPAVSLDSENLSIADYRALRAGREVPNPAETPSVAEEAATPSEAEPSDGAAEPTEQDTTEEPKQEKPKKDRVSARFSELTAKIKALESQLATAKGGSIGQTETKPAADTPAAAADDPEPVAEKFDSYVEWQKTWNRWLLRQEAKAADAARVQAEQKAAQQERAATWAERVKEASHDKTDFAEVAQNPELHVTQVMGHAIQESEIGPNILYHLGKNPEEAARIAKLSPASQVREIGKIEARLETASAETAEPQTKTTPVSKAPAPKRPVGGAASNNPLKNIDSISLAEYRALREAGKLR